jgi:hypothetical protein
MKTFTKGVTVFAKFRQFFAKTFARKPQSDKKWYKISVEKEYMEPEPWFFGLLDPDPVRILVLFEEKGNSMLKIIKQSKHLQRKVQYKKYYFYVWGHF